MARFVRRWDMARGVYVLEFARGPRTIVVAWSESGDPVFQMRHAPGKRFITRPSGKRVTETSTDGILRIHGERSPAIYDVPRPE